MLSPAAPDGSNGWYREPVTVTWQVSDAESPVIGPAGCAPVSLDDLRVGDLQRDERGGDDDVRR